MVKEVIKEMLQGYIGKKQSISCSSGGDLVSAASGSAGVRTAHMVLCCLVWSWYLHERRPKRRPLNC